MLAYCFLHFFTLYFFSYDSSSRLNFGSGEVATGPRSESPIIDVEAVSDEELEAKQSIVGQSLTAALPSV